MSSENNVHGGHRKRAKKRFRDNGLSSFENHNVLELLLFYAVPRIDTNVIAHNLINDFGSISKVFDAPIDQLVKTSGVTENSATLIHLIPQLARLYLEDKAEDLEVLDSSDKIGTYFSNKFISETNEIVYMLSLDSSCNVISCDILAHGVVSQANVSIRKIIDIVVRYNVSSVVLAHNHPRGLAVASNEDVITTKFLFDALKLLDIPLLDHIIVAQNEYISLANLGYIG